MDNVPKNPDLPDPEENGKQYIKKAPVSAMKMDKPFDVKTIEGDVKGKEGDYLCKGANGEYWPIDKDIFEKTYEELVIEKEDEVEETVKEDVELHDDDEFSESPVISTEVSLYAPNGETWSDKKLADVFGSGIQAFLDTARKLGGEPDWYARPDWYKGDEEYQPNLTEGLSPLSHDNSINRKIRKHRTPRSKRHMQGSDRYRRTDPVKRVKARLKRDSRHQPRPEVEEAFSFITKYIGKPITESDIQNVNIELFADAIDLLSAMALGGWSKTDDGISNGRFVLENENINIAQNGQLTYHNAPLKLNWDWLYATKQFIDKRLSEDNKKSW